MDIFEKRLQVSPAEYNWAKEIYEISSQNPWTHTEIPMSSDAVHWNSSRLTDNDRKAISGILRGFTVIEEVVGQHWANLANIFPKPEIVSMCRFFAAQEWVHAYAYDLLETTIGIAEQNWAAFQQDKNALKKLGTYTDYLLLDAGDVKADPSNLAKGLAIFGGCAEGVSLFGSFALLLSFPNKDFFPGMNQILSWSVRDEDAHSIAAINLYHELVRQFPEARLTKEEAFECFDIAVQLEKDFIEPAFENGNLTSGISYFDMVDFIHHRANLKLNQLGFPERYLVKENKIASKDVFTQLTKNTVLHDFFYQSQNGSSYTAKPSQDFNSVSFDFAF